AAPSAAPGSTTDKAEVKPADRPVPDKTDRMPVEEKLSADKSPDKPLVKSPDKPAAKIVDKPADKLPDKPADRPRAVERPRPQPAEDDLLGKLHGGTKPGEAKAADA